MDAVAFARNFVAPLGAGVSQGITLGPNAPVGSTPAQNLGWRIGASAAVVQGKGGAWVDDYHQAYKAQVVASETARRESRNATWQASLQPAAKADWTVPAAIVTALAIGTVLLLRRR